jgi:hypothetical protein
MARYVVLREWYEQGSAAVCAGIGGLWAWHGHGMRGADPNSLAAPGVIVRNEAVRMPLPGGAVTGRQGRVLAPGSSTEKQRLRESQRKGDEHAKEVHTQGRRCGGRGAGPCT